MPPIVADPAIATGPFLAASMAPVKPPLVMECQGSSFPLTWAILKSVVENKPPPTANLPPNCRALVLIAVKFPHSLWSTPTGELQKPLIASEVPPPMIPTLKAPPQSTTIRQGQGCRAYSSILTLPVQEIFFWSLPWELGRVSVSKTHKNVVVS